MVSKQFAVLIHEVDLKVLGIVVGPRSEVNVRLIILMEGYKEFTCRHSPKCELITKCLKPKYKFCNSEGSLWRRLFCVIQTSSEHWK